MIGICEQCENCPSCINGQCGELLYVETDIFLTAMLHDRCVCDVAKDKEAQDGNKI